MTDADVAGLEPVVKETEKWFVSHGQPHLIEDYNATEHVLTRAIPFLVVLLVVQLFRAVRVGWPDQPLWLVGVVVLAITVATRIGLNLIAGRELWRQADSVGIVEASAFAVIPAIAWLVATGDSFEFFRVLVTNYVILVVIYVITSFGVVRGSARGLQKALSGIGSAANLAIRALPLLLVVFALFFINSELWQVSHSAEPVPFWTAILLILTVAALAVILLLRRELEGINYLKDPDKIVAFCKDTPVGDIAPALAVEAANPPPLKRRQRTEVALLFLYSTGQQVAIVSLFIVVFFSLFGLFAVPISVLEMWIGESVLTPVFSFDWFGSRVFLTWELIRVSALLGALSALYFAVNIVIDQTYRDQFFTEIATGVERTLAVRAVYLMLLDRIDASESTVSQSVGDHVTMSPEIESESKSRTDDV
ncbi:hypothetical protein [Haloferax profundi]|uniref:hypothetical protein n=1 Tax=Haloferax profundi TaxID=1544718 RepID=UPI0012FA5ACD|nr:hypothetical protein [Haloferax profundi]